MGRTRFHNVGAAPAGRQMVLLGPARWGHTSKPWGQPQLRMPSPPSQGNTDVRALWGPRLSSLPPRCGRSCPRPAVGPPHCQKALVSNPPPTHTEDELVSRVPRGWDSGASSRRSDRLRGGGAASPPPSPGGRCVLWAAPLMPVGCWGAGLDRAVGTPHGIWARTHDPPTPAPVVQNDGIILNHSHAPGIIRITCRFGAVCPEAKVIWDEGWGGRFEPPSPVLGRADAAQQLAPGPGVWGALATHSSQGAACWSRWAVGAAKAALCWGQFLIPEAKAGQCQGWGHSGPHAHWGGRWGGQGVSALGGDS